MPKKQPKKQPLQGRYLYQRILRELTAIDQKLPENKRLAYRQRARIASQLYQSKYKGLPASKVKIRAIQADAKGVYDKVKPQADCDINLLPTRFFAEPIDWFAIDEFIQNELPKCIYIRVNAGPLGRTKIFNTRNYSYVKSGVRDIYEAIRPEANDASEAFWSGYKKLKPNRKNDGTPENYYIDFILQINDEILGDTTSVNFKHKPTKSNIKKEKNVHQLIAERVNKRRVAEKRRKAFRREMPARLKELKQLQSAIKKSKQKKKGNKAKFAAKVEAAIRRVERAYNEGFISEYAFKNYLKKIYKFKPNRKT